MKTIPRELQKPNTNSSFHRELRKRLSLSDLQKKVLIGSLMGDGCLIANSSNTNYRLQIEHCSKQKEYVWWKYEIFKDFVLAPPAYHQRTDSWQFRTLSHSELSDFHTLFYQKGKKILPKNIDSLTDSLVSAVWFMDDGGKLGKGCLLNIQNFTDKESLRLKTFFERRLKMPVTLQRNKGHFRLYIPVGQRDKWVDLLSDNLREEFQYKVL